MHRARWAADAALGQGCLDLRLAAEEDWRWARNAWPASDGGLAAQTPRGHIGSVLSVAGITGAVGSRHGNGVGHRQPRERAARGCPHCHARPATSSGLGLSVAHQASPGPSRATPVGWAYVRVPGPEQRRLAQWPGRRESQTSGPVGRRAELNRICEETSALESGTIQHGRVMACRWSAPSHTTPAARRRPKAGPSSGT